MFVQIEPDYDAMSRRAASVLVAAIRQKPRAVLGLATGGTPRGTYQHFVRMARAQALDLSQITTFNLDEYLGLAADHPQSCRGFLQAHLLEPLALHASQTHFLDSMTSDAVAECRRFEDRISAAGGIDVQVLGIGGDGHLAFCEPGSSLAGRTGLAALHPRTIADNARFFEKPEQVPRRALTLGIGTILEARCCLILANGTHKADVWAGMIEGPVSAQLPASALQHHPWTIALCDAEAASQLESRDYYQQADRALSDQPAIAPWVLERETVRRQRPSPPA